MTTPTTPRQLKRLMDEKCWGDQRLADEIFLVTGARLSARTIARFVDHVVEPHETTQKVIDKFMKAQEVVR